MKKIIFLIQFLYLSVISWGLNFSIAPTKFEIDLSKRSNHEVYLINNTAKPLRIEVFTEIPNSYEKYNLNSNITIFPKVVSIKPGAKQEVRFRIKPTENMENGEYRSLLVFKESSNKIKTTVEKTPEMTTEMELITEVAINISGKNGKSKILGEIKKIISEYNNDGSLYIEAEILSKGNTALKIDYVIKNENKEVVKGRLGNSLRTGENKIGKEISLDMTKIKSKELKLILLEQNKKILYEGKINL